MTTEESECKEWRTCEIAAIIIGVEDVPCLGVYGFLVLSYRIVYYRTGPSMEYKIEWLRRVYRRKRTTKSTVNNRQFYCSQGRSHEFWWCWNHNKGWLTLPTYAFRHCSHLLRRIMLISFSSLYRFKIIKCSNAARYWGHEDIDVLV